MWQLKHVTHMLHLSHALRKYLDCFRYVGQQHRSVTYVICKMVLGLTLGINTSLWLLLVKPGFYMILTVCDWSATQWVTWWVIGLHHIADIRNICPWCLWQSAAHNLSDGKRWTRFNFPNHSDCVPHTTTDAGDKCFHMSETWCRLITDC